MKVTDAYIGLGSNLGDRGVNLIQATEMIESRLGDVINKSPLYETAAFGKTNQPDFYNQVIVVRTGFIPEELLNELHEIEKNMGRKRVEKWGSRHIDLDILFYGELIQEDGNFKVPHPGIQYRKFVLAPLNDIAPHFVHPKLGITVGKLFKMCPDDSRITLIEA